MGTTHQDKIFESREDELNEGFEDAKKWFGLIMSLEEFRSFIWSNKGPLSDNTVLFAHKYDKQRRKCIKNKVERNIKINGDQLAIEDYYLTSKGGLIAWVKTDPRLVSEIHRRAQKSGLKDFRTTIFVPKAARDRKSCVDRLLVGYKKLNPDFRYLVRNRENDIKILIKRISEGEKLPYRNLEINVLGRVSPLKTVCKPEADDEDEQTDTVDDNFQR